MGQLVMLVMKPTAFNLNQISLYIAILSNVGFHLPRVLHAKQILLQRATSIPVATDIPKGHLAVYVGENPIKKKRYVIPVSYLNQPSFQDLLSKAKKEYGYDHPMGGLTIPCSEEKFMNLTSHLNNNL
ncbi:hypothetical protein IFM89_035499 [Coptis chinensis]|uniref:Small auxin up regulated protein n=1 Tax=Coptis chinensis TaxID=261450 RepID=A0A835HRP5_9MAGN|nr:hypothetical protein IFM89_035499 [Coptis chinensis]